MNDKDRIKIAVGCLLLVGTVVALFFAFRGGGGDDDDGPSKAPSKAPSQAPENLQAFTRDQKYPEGTKSEIGPNPPTQSKSQYANNVRFADQVYVKEFGGPFGSGKEYMTAMKGSQSSPGYGFRGTPPSTSLSTSKFDNYPSVYDNNGIIYRAIKGQTCTAEPMAHLMSMVIDTCDATCTKDNGCIGYHFNFTTGSCHTFGECDDLKKAGTNTKLFVKSQVYPAQKQPSPMLKGTGGLGAR